MCQSDKKGIDVATIPSGMDGSIGEGEASALLAGEELLASDSVPDANQKAICFSCDRQMVGLFCYACGQKNDDYRRSIWSLISETFASIFSLENRIWRTWLTLLLKPGKVAREFSDGKRTIWTSPVRIYLAMSIVLFGYMSLTETRIFSIRTDVVAKAGMFGDVATLSDESVKLKPDFGYFRRQAELDLLNKDVDFDRVSRLMQGTVKQAFDFDGDLLSLGLDLDNENLKSIGVWPTDLEEEIADELIDAREEALEEYQDRIDDVIDSYNRLIAQTNSPDTIADRILSAEQNSNSLNLLSELNSAMDEKSRNSAKEALEKIDETLLKLGLSRELIHKLPVEKKSGFSFNLGEGQVNGLTLTRQDVQRLFVQVLKNPALLNDGISRYLPRIMFLMMPLAAIIGLTFIRGRENALLYDHIVHAAYIHAVTFGFLLILILLTHWTPFNSALSVFFIGILIYLPMSTKRMFKRGWFKTIFASYGIAFFYSFNMLLIVTLLTADSIKHAVLSSQI